MRAIVPQVFTVVSEPLEGRVAWLYLDLHGWLTTGVGWLADDCRTLNPPRAVLELPFEVDERRARGDEIAAEWRHLAVMCCESTKAITRRTGKPPTGDPLVCAWRGTSRRLSCLAHQGHLAARAATRLRLSTEAIDALTLRTLDAKWAALMVGVPELGPANADAQLAMCLWAWAVGTPFVRWPKLTRAVRSRQWAVYDEDGKLVGGAAFECRIASADNPGVRERNRLMRRLFEAAARVDAHGLDPDVLWGWAPPDAPTRPQIVAVPDTSVQDAARATLGARRQMMGDALGPDDDGPDAA